ncbi:MAG: peptidoglycan DD-metalloendopeptidase family protein [Parvibaculum sp.]
MRGVHHKGSDFADGIRRFIRHHYVERQIYLRSHGQVQFISLSPFTQAVFLGIAVVSFGWVAFSSVNVVFKQQIIASKDQRYVKMQSAYEERMAQLQSSYDELNGQLVISQERFLATTRELEDKHRHLAALMGQRRAASSELDQMRERYAATLQKSKGQTDGNTVLMSVDQESEGVNIAQTTTRPQHHDASATYVIDGGESGGLDVASLAGSGLADNADQIGTVSLIDAKLTNLDHAQQNLINTIDETTDRRIRELTSIIDMTNVADVGTLVKKNGSAADTEEMGEGGPLLGLAEGEALAGAGNENAFSKQLSRVSNNINALTELENTIAKLPLAEPLNGYHESSGFGPRRDPFTGRMAFHAGEDMATAWGTPVYATTSGTVAYAGPHGAYGNMIEINVGNGFKTRYGHLSRINVKVGQKIAFRDIIGRVGSTGRSSGPHLHYEVWFDGIVRDPTKFVEAGHYVFTKQR